MEHIHVITDEEEQLIRDYFEKQYKMNPDGYSGYSLKTARETEGLLFVETYDSWNYHDESWDEVLVTFIEKSTDEKDIAPADETIVDRFKRYIRDYEHIRWYQINESIHQIPGCLGSFRILRINGNDRDYWN